MDSVRVRLRDATRTSEDRTDTGRNTANDRLGPVTGGEVRRRAKFQPQLTSRDGRSRRVLQVFFARRVLASVSPSRLPVSTQPVQPCELCHDCLRHAPAARTCVLELSKTQPGAAQSQRNPPEQCIPVFPQPPLLSVCACDALSCAPWLRCRAWCEDCGRKGSRRDAAYGSVEVAKGTCSGCCGCCVCCGCVVRG